MTSHFPAIATGHLGWNRQPVGGSVLLGGSPEMTGRLRNLFSGSGSGTAAMSAFVYGCNGLSIMALEGPISTMRPAYITAILSEKCLAVAMS